MAWWDDLVCELCREDIDPGDIEWGERIPKICRACLAGHAELVARPDDNEWVDKDPPF